MYDEYIQKILDKSGILETEISTLINLFKPVEFSRGDTFLRAGDFQESIGLVVKGLFRYYYIDTDGNDHSKHFSLEGDLVMSFSSYINNSKSDFYIEAIEDSVVLAIEPEKLKNLLNNKVWKEIYYKALEQSYCLK